MQNALNCSVTGESARQELLLADLLYQDVPPVRAAHLNDLNGEAEAVGTLPLSELGQL